LPLCLFLLLCECCWGKGRAVACRAFTVVGRSMIVECISVLVLARL
jgi:hypothetical protein